MFVLKSLFWSDTIVYEWFLSEMWRQLEKGMNDEMDDEDRPRVRQSTPLKMQDLTLSTITYQQFPVPEAPEQSACPYKEFL